MFENLIRWFTGGTDAEKEQAGYDWAKSALKSDSDTCEDILKRCEAPFDGPNPFDAGACRCVYELQGDNHDRTHP